MGTSVGSALNAAISAVRDAVHRQDAAPLSAADLLGWGVAFTEITTTLAGVSRHLERRIVHYGDHRLLRDDQGADPYERLGEMRRHLAALALALTEAAVQAQAYHAAATHVDVEVDLDAGPR